MAGSRITTGLIALVALAAGIWIASATPGVAQQPQAPANAHVRYALSTMTDGSALLLDTWTGDTWALAFGSEPKLLKQWVKVPNRDAGPRKGD